jgi:hypothetical protein
MGIRTKGKEGANDEAMSIVIRVLAVLAVWVVVPIIYGLGYLLRYPTPGHKWAQGFDQWFLGNVLAMGGFFWLIVIILSIISLIVWGGMSSELHDEGTKTPIVTTIGVVVTLAMIVSSVYCGWATFWDADKNFGRFYTQSTVFYVPDVAAPPQALSRLTNGAARGDGKQCDLVGTSDVFGCVKQDSLPTDAWDTRVGSLDGAKIALTRTSGSNGKVSLDNDSLTYLNAWKGQPAQWSGIMDGSDIQQPMAGVAQWHGSGTPNQCMFEKDYAIDRAISGSARNDLPDKIAETFPFLNWQKGDEWGYCDGAQPIVVIPVTQQVHWMDRTVDTAAGIIVVQGDHGTTKLTYKNGVKPGEYPGPVYPLSLVERQREQAMWAAGRQNMERNGFGFEPATSNAQAGNVSDYLLRDSQTGRLVYVTPLTLRNSTSELFVAYAESYADEVSNGQLNQMSIYVLADNDQRRINIDNLEADARNYLLQKVPGFFSSDGKLVEFVPVDGDIWRAFGELNGRVVYQLDISANKTVAPVLINLDSNTPVDGAAPAPPSQTGQSGQPAPQPSGFSLCGNSPDTMSSDQVATCVKTFVDELAKRANAPK